MNRQTHVLTVHWKNPQWIKPQSQYLEANLGKNYHSYAFLNGIDSSYNHFFNYVDPRDIGDHARKLNLLAEHAVQSADKEDILLFIDGDAFPITPLAEKFELWLKEYPLVAVQRLENNGDIQPHPCFCVTTVGFWEQLKADWNQGYQWLNNNNELVTDVGGNLLGQLEKQQVQWLALNRSNTTDLHPLWYGVYGDVVYHHGAGFRAPISRIDLQQRMGWLDQQVERFRQYLPEDGKLGQLKHRLRPIGRFSEEIARKNQLQAQSIYQQICTDPLFYLQFKK